MDEKDGIGEIVGDKPYSELVDRRDKEELVNAWECEVGEGSGRYIERMAEQVKQEEDPLTGLVEFMARYKYADEMGESTTASRKLGYRQKNLDAVIKEGWGGCNELAELAARVALATKIDILMAYVINVRHDQLGPHSVVYFPQINKVLDPSLHIFSDARQYFDENVLRLLADKEYGSKEK